MREHLRRGGREIDRMTDLAHRTQESFTPFLGVGTGGSSALYGMVMERLFPQDFTPRRYFPDAPATANLVDAWPIGYEELAPYYAAAETLYGVKASPDPLRPADETRGTASPPPFSAGNAELVASLRGRQAHPYYLPMACAYVPGCAECIGFLCSRKCKGDSATVCLEPALDTQGAHLLPDCDVRSLETSNGRADGVQAIVSGVAMRLKAKRVILGAGAIHSPAILLRSGDTTRPGGLANASGELGRNLMRHYLDYWAVYPQTPPATGDLVKQVAFNDLYVVEGTKYGTVQSNGRMPPTAAMVGGVQEDLRAKSPLAARAFPMVRPLVTRAITKILDRSLVLASIMEDLPYRTNGIGIADDGQSVTYRYELAPYERERIANYRKYISALLKPERHRLLKSAERNRMLGHMCGTCRFGDDPRTSVLDRDNRVHDLENVFVIDSSFFPSSGGTNPSLTIAANALRVADRIGPA